MTHIIRRAGDQIKMYVLGKADQVRTQEPCKKDYRKWESCSHFMVY